MSRDEKRIIIAFVFMSLSIIFIPIYLAINPNHTPSPEERLNNTCMDKFGSAWQGRIGRYDHDICVNSKGEVKYP